MPKILTFGDSNTYGTAPMEHRQDRRRFTSDTRWPQVMARQLGPDWELVEEGLPGRTTCHDDPVMGAHMNGQTGLRIALASHAPLDVLTILLGTNDLKTRFNPSPQRIAAGAAALLDIALSADVQALHGPFRILLICPPPVIETGCLAVEFFGAETAGKGLTAQLAAVAASRNVAFFDAGTVTKASLVDGVHLDAHTHRDLGAAMADQVSALIQS